MGTSVEYSRWATADQSCASYAAYVEGLKEKRAEAVRYAWQNPAAATEIVARLDAQLASAASIRRTLWLRRMQAYQAHRDHLAAGRRARKNKAARKHAAEAAFMGAIT